MTITTIEIREAFPPHRLLFDFAPGEGSGYGLQISDVNTANFNLSRGDVMVAKMANLLPGRKRIGNCVVFKRDDGLFPWLGWTTRYNATPGGLYYQYVATDPGYLLKSNAMSKTGVLTGSVGRVLLDGLGEIQGRAVMPFSLARISEGGPYIDFAPNAKDALAFVTQLAQHANYEWWWDIDAGRAESAKVYLRFEERKGRDKRTSVIWRESEQLNVGAYTQDAEGYYNEILVVGGTGAFADRPAVSVSEGGAQREGVEGAYIGAGSAVIASGSPVFGGSKVVVQRSVTAPAALESAGQSRAQRPDEFGEHLRGELIEASTNMQSWEVGDTITAELQSTDLGVPLTLGVRVMGVDLRPDTGQHALSLQVV